jgi:hypothetical protein
MALGRKTGGRKKGSLNKITQEASAARAAAAASGMTPLDYMLSVMRDEKADRKRRDAMAVAAAPYIHSRVTPSERPGLSVSLKDGDGARSVKAIEITFVDPPARYTEDQDA